MTSSTIDNLSLTNAVDICDHKIDIQFVHPPLSGHADKEVSVQPLVLHQYNQKEVSSRNHQVKCLNFPLRDVCKRHCEQLSDSMHKQDWNYSFEMMTFVVSLPVISGGGISGF